MVYYDQLEDEASNEQDFEVTKNTYHAVSLDNFHMDNWKPCECKMPHFQGQTRSKVDCNQGEFKMAA